MEKNVTEKGKFLGFYFIGYFVFIISIVLITFLENPYISSFALIAFFIIPGLFLTASIKPTKIRYNPIELMLISFGVSLILIIMITYFLILMDKFKFINVIYIILTTTSLIWLIIRYKILKNNCNQNNFDNSFTKKIYFFIKEEKESFIILILIIIFFFLCFFLKQYNIFRFPDEYFYLWASDQAILRNLMYRGYIFMDFNVIISSQNKLGFILILSFYYTLVGTTVGIIPHILSIFFYSLLIPTTYLVGSLHNKKTGIIAAIFIASNPLVWFWSNHIYPDIPYTVITTAFFYFFFNSFKKRGKISFKYLIPTIIFGFASYTQQPKIIFVWAIPFAVYFLSTLTRKEKNSKFLTSIIILSIIGFILTSILLIFIAPWFFEYDLKNILESLFSIYKFNLQDWIDFLSQGGTLWDIIGFPYNFSHTIIILFIVGTVVFIKTHSKRAIFVFIFSVLFTIFFHSTQFSYYDARFSLIIYPLLMAFAAIAFSKKLGYYSLFLIPFLFLIFPLIPLNEPGSAISPPIGNLVGLISRIIGLLLIIYKIYEGVMSKHIKITSNFIKKFKNPSFFLLIITTSSLFIGNVLSTNEDYWRNETISPEDVGLPQAGEWIMKNVPMNSIIITNCRPVILNYYTNNSFNSEAILNTNFREGWIFMPKDEEDLNKTIRESNYDYLIVFTHEIVAEIWRRPYFKDYIIKDNIFTVYKPLANKPILVYNCNL